MDGQHLVRRGAGARPRRDTDPPPWGISKESRKGSSGALATFVNEVRSQENISLGNIVLRPALWEQRAQEAHP